MTTASVIQDTVTITEEAMGWIEAKINPEVSAEVSGRIQRVYVDTGQMIEAGMPMLTIDSAQLKLEKVALQSEVDRLEALIVNQERTVTRHHNLLAKNSISQERLDNAEVQMATLKKQLEGAKARLAENKRRLNKTSVVAPVNGWIEKRFVSKGDFVKQGTPLYIMITDQLLRIVLPFPENVASSLATGQQVKLTSPLTPGLVVTSQISQIRPGVNIHSRAIEVIIYLANPGAWRAGGTINGTVILAERENGLLVPSIAIVRRPAGEVVYQIDNHTARQRKVTTGQRQDDLVEIISGLSGDERIAVDGAAFLTDGATVMESQQ
ncbi:MAG: efflux RND transporter periplasmic adaptor subunit [Desulfuromonadales bacterium]|nr:efflux RND transporter periplasmic adaptor subunit [Desulfuromonadales bacterium]